MKRTDELNALKDLNTESLREKLGSMQKELMNLRFRQASGQLEKSSHVRLLRRNVARAKTLLQMRAQGSS